MFKLRHKALDWSTSVQKETSTNNCLGGGNLNCLHSAIDKTNFVEVFLRTHTQFNKSVED